MIPVLALFGLGSEELLAILLIVLILFGGSKIPELARSLGKAKAEFKKAQSEGVEPSLPPPPSEEEKVRKAARDLGIPTEGRSVEELKREILRRLS